MRYFVLQLAIWESPGGETLCGSRSRSSSALLPLLQRWALLLNLRDAEGGGMIGLVPATGVAGTGETAAALEISEERLEAFWNDVLRISHSSAPARRSSGATGRRRRPLAPGRTDRWQVAASTAEGRFVEEAKAALAALVTDNPDSAESAGSSRQCGQRAHPGKARTPPPVKAAGSSQSARGWRPALPPGDSPGGSARPSSFS